MNWNWKALLTRDTKGAAPAKPKHIEVWGHLVGVNRGLMRMVLLQGAIALISVVGMTWALRTALDKPLIYYVDSDGHATAGGRIGDASHPLEVEVTFVAKEFLRRTIGMNSLTVARDFAESFNLMTAELQQKQQAQLEEWKNEKGIPFVEYIRAAEIRTILEFTTIEIENHGGERFSIRLIGVHKTWPIDSDAQAEPKVKSFESHLALVSVPRTEESPNGLLVSHQTIKYFESENLAEDFVDSKGLEEGTNNDDIQ